MRIAVIADTHDRLPPVITSAIRTADAIWHLGDVCSANVLDQLSHLGPCLRFVRGNCDSCVDWPMQENFSLEGFQIRLVHIPPRLAPKGVDIVLHGHTHVPRNEVLGSTRFLNPGCITRPNRGVPRSYAWLSLSMGQPLDWQLERF